MKNRLAATCLALLLIGAIYLAAKEKGGVNSSEGFKASSLSKSFLKLINHRNYDQCRDLMAHSLRGTMSTNRLKKLFDPIMDTMGTFNHAKVMSMEKVFLEDKDYVLCKIKSIYEKGSLNLSILVNPELQIEGVYLK